MEPVNLDEQHLLKNQLLPSSGAMLLNQKIQHENEHSADNTVHENHNHNVHHKTTGQKIAPGLMIKVIALVLLTVQAASNTLMLRYVRGIRHEGYLIVTSVMMSELFKLSLCLVALLKEELWNVRAWLSRLGKILRVESCGPLIVPALCYFIQNLLSAKAMDYIDAFTAQALQQFRIVTTGIFSVIMLGRLISSSQWRAMLLLCLGLMLVFWKPDQSRIEDNQNSVHVDARTNDNILPSLAPLDLIDKQLQAGENAAKFALGVMFVLVQSTLSGFAGVYVELFIKPSPSAVSQPSRYNRNTSKTIWSRLIAALQSSKQLGENLNLWDRNFQLSIWSLLSAFLAITMDPNAYNFVTTNGFFHGWSAYTVVVTLLSAIGGFLVAFVVRYTDNLIKGFAVAVATVISAACSVIFFRELDPIFPNLVGSALVVIACFNYNG